MKILQVILELSLNKMNNIFMNDIKSDKSRVPYEIRIGRIDKKSKTKISNEKDSVEFEDMSIIKTGVNLVLGKFKSDNKIVYSFMTKTKDNDNKHIQRISFNLQPIINEYNTNKKITINSLLDNDSTVFCDCKSYKYHFSNMNKKNKTFYLGSKNRNKNEYTTKGLRPSGNPRKRGGLCKHLKFDIDFIINNKNKIINDVSKYLFDNKIINKGE